MHGRIIKNSEGLVDLDQAISVFNEMNENKKQGLVKPEKKTTYQKINVAKLKKERCLATLREMDVKKRQGELVDLAEVQVLWFKKLSILRDALLSLPSRVSPIIASKDQNEIENLLNKEIHNLLEELSKGNNGSDPNSKVE
jgi:phage terminase Nu1 subunit (DNA packaging protein)